jgi:hypothetical protein
MALLDIHGSLTGIYLYLMVLKKVSTFPFFALRNASLITRGLLFLFVFSMTAASCSTPMADDVPEDDGMPPEKDSVVFLPRIALGQLPAGLNEISGMAASSNAPGYFWVHNDSGDKPLLYCINEKAELIHTVTVEGASHRDWEDIAVIKDPADGKARVFVADIGDNAAAYDYNTIYILSEPEILPGQNPVAGSIQKIIYRYADGQRDAETLLADPLSGDLFVVSKREQTVGLYRISYPYNVKDTLTLEKTLTLPFTQIVAGDISLSGKDIALKNYFTVYYWQRNTTKSISETLSLPPMLTSYIAEPQGEALCWKNNGSAFYTVSEEGPFKAKPVLYRYDKQ